MASTLKERLEEDLKSSLKAQNKERLGIVRLIRGAIRQKEIDQHISLTDKDIIALLQGMCKQRRESMELYKTGGREDLVAKEAFELSVLQEYLPAQLSEGEILQLVKETIEAQNASSIRDMGKVMGVLKAKLEGKADMSMVGNLVKSLLATTASS